MLEVNTFKYKFCEKILILFVLSVASFSRDYTDSLIYRMENF